MDFEAVCRTCIGTKSLNPIFENKEQHISFSSVMSNTTGLKIELNDGLPQNICIDCRAHINASVKFRVRCKETETKLLLMIQQDIDNTDLFPDEKEKASEETLQTDLGVRIDILKMNDNKLIDLFDNLDNKLNLSNNNLNHTDVIVENKIIDTNNVSKSKKINISNGHEVPGIDCNINITESPSIKIEDELELKVKKRRVMCKICKKSLSIRSVDTHMSTRHPGVDERKVKCDLCDTYVLKMKLNRHLHMMHGKDYSICAYCKLQFFTKESLIDHVSSCAGKKRKRNSQDTGKEMSECDICQKKMQKASLKMHQKIKHAGLGPACDHCNRKFGNKFRLNEHLRSKHGYEKYKCAECEFQSASIVAMRNHERRHRGEKPYVCELCGARFHAAYLLPQHRQSHRTEKPVKCDLCPASFKANNSLHMHKAACHSTRVYKCMLCERAYSCRNYAAKHMRSVHGYSGAMSHFHVKPAR